MNDNEFDIGTEFVRGYINDLFVEGEDSPSIALIKKSFNSEFSDSVAKPMIKLIINYFEASESPTKDFLFFVGVDDIDDGMGSENYLHICQVKDKLNSPYLGGVNFSGDGYKIINVALALDKLGLKNNSDEMMRIGIRLLIEELFSDEISVGKIKKIVQVAISDAQREKAKKPRNPYYSEVIQVLRLTWGKYPAAPKTGILDDLAVHYHRKVSRNALNSWIDASGLRPPIPEKYSSYQLVFPPITG